MRVLQNGGRLNLTNFIISQVLSCSLLETCICSVLLLGFFSFTVSFSFYLYSSFKTRSSLIMAYKKPLHFQQMDPKTMLRAPYQDGVWSVIKGHFRDNSLRWIPLWSTESNVRGTCVSQISLAAMYAHSADGESVLAK